ncbi:MAG TPA: 30S ribosomal protein S17e [Candidatus Syntrophoarchaeum butanivorans]|uniref:Small ribosomal subunit protein eS17 n=1 Tax=Candidatus Syntropharchaeum butanivorans TaxID=1839936 RepID=A0A1F2P3K9_9EURY|nr:MAG: Ribosomal protein S17e [Candidatus Syntrophoarchaeum butanivorans]RJS70589.1 MAG: 30S ribosomal protein S17e [Candidatus Syntrophoarchaeum sp. WYZ-LMO15]HDM36078.1 30S ribosomal protein S17e [Candidatus Syntrophoarchaeum butanivorans]HEC56307.1 30S ribosomal protein S17e [Candidatus Syntrophoarchaeum butanivorans]
MGNVRPNYIKVLGESLLKAYKDKFTGDFEVNKRLVEEYTNVKSKRVRNRVAGYITSKINRERRNKNKMYSEDEVYA